MSYLQSTELNPYNKNMALKSLVIFLVKINWSVYEYSVCNNSEHAWIEIANDQYNELITSKPVEPLSCKIIKTLNVRFLFV